MNVGYGPIADLFFVMVLAVELGCNLAIAQPQARLRACTPEALRGVANPLAV
jgi:hypothetical protein